MTDDVFQLEGTMIDQKYRVGPVVARGGFGVVYRGEQVRLRRPVAIKVLSWTGDPSIAVDDIAEQFVAEAELLARLDHPAIVRVLDVGSTQSPVGRSALWMALEWVEGCTLVDDILARPADARRTPAECLALLRPVVEALALAHAHGIAHRDIKPGNIMLVTPPADAARAVGRPLVRLLDFGIAKVMASDEHRPTTGETATTSKLSAFSARYAAPEQISGSRTGPWTDVHAIALLFTHLLTMRAPYPGDDALSVAARALAADRPTPRAFGVDVGAWEPVLAKALSLHPAERYPDAGALLAALDAALAESRPRAREDALDGTVAPALSPRSEPRIVPAASPEASEVVRDALGDSVRADERAAPVDPVRRFGARHAVAAMALVAIVALVVGALRRADGERETSVPRRVVSLDVPVTPVDEPVTASLDASTADLDDAVSTVNDAADVTDAPTRRAAPTPLLRAHRDAGPRPTTVPPIPLGP